MPSVYETTIGPIIEASRTQGASEVFLAEGRSPYIRAGESIVPLEDQPSVTAADLELFIEEFGYVGLLVGTIRFHAHRSSSGSVTVTLRHVRILGEAAS